MQVKKLSTCFQEGSLWKLVPSRDFLFLVLKVAARRCTGPGRHFPKRNGVQEWEALECQGESTEPETGLEVDAAWAEGVSGIDLR